ncbi:DNA-3-methyladenine glycosylase I [Parvularcula flava]|uniref:DNA-3-methyladenine glycosylase I n=1 Tax=Aquisalinus luteolus TaxID=1566827 RepID=A0A8J3A3P9_9PROT|nr:DNA-3-methyladenine glycosylase I [Aquisalinus luteolus]NHK28950.1 DNA-3-methyladenine glycosylase I [Aquisalinus luteolus]GGI00764.1 DNA-3-methyladenine glycosylase [Aquisalinus luteolus]
MKRCAWVPEGDDLYAAYHDEEWGVPERDARALYEKLILDGFQAGLSWRTILYKRENFRAAFKGFEPEKVARFGEKDVTRLLGDAGIIRHRGKIEGAIKNAQIWLDMREAGEDFSDYLWNYVDGAPLQGNRKTIKDVPAATPLSEAISKDMKKRGFKFCGPTIIYAFMQAVGMVNDHTADCHRHAVVKRMG